MEDKLDNKILIFLKKDLRSEYTTPDISKGVGISNRETIISALSSLAARDIIEISRKKGRIKYYRIKTPK